MNFNESSNLYYRILTNVSDYFIFKENKLSYMSQDDFDRSFMIIMFKEGLHESNENDLNISEVKSGYNSDYYDYDIKNYDDKSYLGNTIVTVDL